MMTGKIEMKAKFANAHEELWPGQYVDVTLRVGNQAKPWWCPKRVQTGQDGAYAYVVAGRPCSASTRGGRALVGIEFVVIRRGLTPGEQVVTDGQIRLRDGATVEIKPAPAPPASQSSPQARRPSTASA